MPKRVAYEDKLKPLNLRVQPASKEWIDTQAKALDVSATVLVRAMLSVAAKHYREVAAKVQQLKVAEKEADSL